MRFVKPKKTMQRLFFFRGDEKCLSASDRNMPGFPAIPENPGGNSAGFPVRPVVCRRILFNVFLSSGPECPCSSTEHPFVFLMAF